MAGATATDYRNIAWVREGRRMPVDNLVLFVAEYRRVRQSDGMQRR